MKKSFFIVVLFSIGGLLWADTRPNIILMIADDMSMKDWATIHSLRGNPCRLRWNQAGTPTISHKGEAVPFIIKGRDIIFETQADAVYELEEKR